MEELMTLLLVLVVVLVVVVVGGILDVAVLVVGRMLELELTTLLLAVWQKG
jgi:uncharacterized membrane protein